MGFMFPHSVFVEDLQKLGFSLNDGITNLMPIVTYCSDDFTPPECYEAYNMTVNEKLILWVKK